MTFILHPFRLLGLALLLCTALPAWAESPVQGPPSVKQIKAFGRQLAAADMGAASTVAQPGQDAPAPVKPAQWAAQGEQSCIKCHDDPRDRSVLHTAHGVKGDARTPMADHACESCHGPSPDHNNARPPKGEKRPPTDVVFKGEFTSPPEKRNAICQGCHQGGTHINWPGSQHQTSDVTCTDCHVSHTTTDPVMNKKTEPEVCFTCHQEQRAESFQLSHHPIREGKVGCSDCHNTHGSTGQTLLKEFTNNEVCVTCHMEKCGPLMWEHEPVRDDCMTCHKPHGSSQPALLTQREPFLCLTCHQTSRSNHEGLVSGNNQLPGNSTPATYNMLLGGSCSACHSKVHGSNAPSGGMLTH